MSRSSPLAASSPSPYGHPAPGSATLGSGPVAAGWDMKPILACIGLALSMMLAACEQKPEASAQPPAPAASTPPPAAAHSPSQQLPALYSGVIPCADCPGIRYELDLRADNVFFERSTYLGREPDNVFDGVGHWSMGDDKVLGLFGGGSAPQLWSMDDVNSLRKLDVHGKPIESQLNYTLTRQETYAPLAPKLKLRGAYQYMADAGVFEECLTGLKLAVAQEGDNAALEAAYTKSRKEPGQTLLASVEGQIVRRPAMEGDRMIDTLVVERFDQLWPNESCGARGVTHELEGTRWVLVRLGEELITLKDGQRELSIALEPSEHRVAGYAGCNRLIGAYELNGDRITFKQMALTRMACPDMKYESAFAKAVEATRAWKITGPHLEFFDEGGNAVARFEERNL